MNLGLIVEGHGETDALPILVRRLVAGYHLSIPKPLRLPRGKMTKPAELKRAVELMARKTTPDGGLLILLDADDDCPVDVASELLSVARAERSDRQIAVVAAQREYEAWLIAGLATTLQVPSQGALPQDPELIRDAKGWLDRNLPHGYRETTDQARLTAQIDLSLASEAASFRKLRREVERLLTRR